MRIPRPQEAIHKAMMYRLLAGILDERVLADKLKFKGGTCAAMLGYLERFSVDLDFDVSPEEEPERLRSRLQRLFGDLGLVVRDESRQVLQFFLKYKVLSGGRNTLRLEILPQAARANQYEVKYLSEIGRHARCQTRETMVANKLVALVDRFEKHRSIAGRDVYDIHYFFSQGYAYDAKVIEERRKKGVREYLQELREFIEKKVTETVINQDLNSLLPYEEFKVVRGRLKAELLGLLSDEIKRRGGKVRASH